MTRLGMISGVRHPERSEGSKRISKGAAAKGQMSKTA
jgi:hypothetical protein